MPEQECALSASGWTAMGRTENTTAAVWCLRTGKPLWTRAGESKDITACALAASGEFLAVASADQEQRQIVELFHV